jgi:hypothetical protein
MSGLTRQVAVANARASWSAAVLRRFFDERDEAADEVAPVVHPTPVAKAPEDWRSPKPGGGLSIPLEAALFRPIPARVIQIGTNLGS